MKPIVDLTDGEPLSVYGSAMMFTNTCKSEASVAYQIRYHGDARSGSNIVVHG